MSNDVLKNKDNSIINPKIPRYEKLIATELFNNPDGTAKDIELSDSIANYKYIEIYYTNQTLDIFDSSRIDNPSG